MSVFRFHATKFLIVLLCLSPAFTFAGGPPIVVNTTADSGGGSLRNAISIALAGDTIIFNLTFPATINLTSGEINITTPVSILGPPGPVPQVMVRGSNASRIFLATSTGLVYIEGMEFADGQVAGGSNYGAGLRVNSGTMTLKNCIVRNCSANNTIGGGIMANSGATLNLLGCTIRDNYGEAGGGGVQVSSGATANIDNTSIYNNTVGTGTGGGIRTSGTVNITNSTISKNSCASGSGGGIMGDMGCLITVVSSTIADNSAANGDEIYMMGMMSPDEAYINFFNTIIGGSTVGNVYAQGTDVIPTSNGYNICRDLTMGAFMGGVGDQNNVNPLLDTLAPNGGPTATMAISATSPAKDAGTATGTPPTDQRGMPRYGATDIGAFEWQCTSPSLTVTATNPPCPGGTGSAAASAAGGTSPYTFTWCCGVGSGSSVTGLTVGSYTVTVTDANGCDSIGSVGISAATAMTASTTSSNVSCNGACDGTATITAISGGVSPYTYLWGDPAAQSTMGATGLCGGTVSCIITDGNSCSIIVSLTIVDPSAITISTSSTSSNCGASDGTATVTASGGTGTLNYLWDDVSNQTTVTAVGLSAGTYMVIVSDGNSCADTAFETVTALAGPTAGFTVSFSSACLNGNSFDFTNTGSAVDSCGMNCPTFTYDFGDGTPPISGTNNSDANPTYTYSTAGTYTVIQTLDDGSCVSTATQTITVFADVTGSFTSTDASCGGSDGTAIVTVTSGTSPYTYSWDDVGGQTTQIATGLTPGTYTVTVTDANSCSFINAVFVNGSPPPVASIDSSTDVSCFAGSDGSASASATGGTTPLSFLWSDPSSQTNATATGLVAGTYTAIITDANGCLDSVPITIVEPGLLTATAAGTDPGCNGSNDGTATASVGGGTTPYAYAWNDPSSQTTVTATGLDGGSFTVIVTDSNGCINSAIVSLNTPAPAVVLNETIIAESNCNQNGFILLAPSGGVTPYTYLWSTGDTIEDLNGLVAGQYTITVTDSAGCFTVDTLLVGGDLPPSISDSTFDETSCGAEDGIATLTVSNGTPPYTYNWSNGASTQNLAGLAGGIYTLILTDSAGCIAYDTVNIDNPQAPLVAVTGFAESSCGANDGGAVAVVNLGATPYTFNWSNGGTAQSISGLAPGTYILTVTGADGCSGSDAVIISGASGPSIDGFTAIDESSCGASDGAIVLAVSGGLPPYSFNWSSGATTQNPTGITSGVYTVTVADANSCTAVDSVELLSLGSIVLSVATTDANCGTNDGSAVVTVSGGTPPYSYNWSSGDLTANADSLTSGIYIATVSDSSGCSNSIAVSISDVGGATFTVTTVTNVSCNGGSDGGIDITVSGGITPYTYSWSNGASSEDVTGIPAGPYEIDVTDANGCSSSQSNTISEPAVISLTTSAIDANCGSTDGSAVVSSSGGSGSYTFLWSSGGTDSTETSLGAGVYSVMVTDGNGCIQTASAAVSNIGGPVIVTDLIENADCGNPVGSIYISVSGGSTPYAYEWSDLSTDEDLVGVPAGTYSVNVTDSSGCVATASIDISGVPPAFESICMVTVDTVTGTNLIVWEKTQTQGVASYNIYKESTQVGVYFLIGNVPVDSLSEYVDVVSDPAVRSWRYKISVIDSCGNESDLSSDHKTVHLTINLGINNWINLIWDHYEGFAYGSYYIERYTTATGWQTIDSIPANLTSYTDQNTPNSGQLYYMVSANHPDGCFASKTKNYNSSKSNTTAYDAGSVSPLGLTSSTNDVSAAGMCDGDAAVVVTGGVEPYTYLWNDPQAQTLASATGLCAGSYDVMVYDANGDSTTSTAVIGTPTGVGEFDLSQHISIFPNPNRGLFTVDLRLVDKLKHVIIYNVLGERVFIISDNLFGEELIDLRSQPNGVYYIQIISERGIALKKVIVE